MVDSRKKEEKEATICWQLPHLKNKKRLWQWGCSRAGKNDMENIQVRHVNNVKTRKKMNVRNALKKWRQVRWWDSLGNQKNRNPSAQQTNYLNPTDKFHLINWKTVWLTHGKKKKKKQPFAGKIRKTLYPRQSWHVSNIIYIYIYIYIYIFFYGNGRRIEGEESLLLSHLKNKKCLWQWGCSRAGKSDIKNKHIRHVKKWRRVKNKDA